MPRRAELLWQFLFRAQYQRDGFAGRERNMEDAGLEDIFYRGQTPFPVAAMQHMPVPPAGRRVMRGGIGDDAAGGRVGVGAHADAGTLVVNQKMPVVRSLRGGVVVAVQAEGQQMERDGGFAGCFVENGAHLVLYIGRVLPVFHPDALFQCDMRVELVDEDGHVTIKREAFEVVVSLGVNGAVLVFVDAHFIELWLAAFARNFYLFVDLRHQHVPLDVRTQRGYQQAMIAARGSAVDGSRGVPTQAVRDKPFVAQSRLDIDAQVSIEREMPGVDRGSDHCKAAFMRFRAVAIRSSGAVMEIRTYPSPASPKFVPGVKKTPVVSKSQLVKSRAL